MKEPTNFNSRLDEIYLRCDVSNNMTDDPLSQDEFKAEIKQLFLEIIGEDEPLHIQSDFDKIDCPHLKTLTYPEYYEVIKFNSQFKTGDNRVKATAPKKESKE